MTNKIISIALIGSAFMALVPATQAADFAARTELAQRSIKEGLGRDSAPVLKRLPFAGRERVFATLVPTLAKSGDDAIVVDANAKRTEGRDATSLAGEGWWLEVAADGSRVRYRNEAYLDGGLARAVPVTKRPSQDDLEPLA